MNKWKNLPHLKAKTSWDLLKCSTVKLALKEVSNRPVRIGQCSIIYKPTTQEQVNDKLN